MTREIINLTRESELNSLLKDKSTKRFNLFYYSEWDPTCKKVLDSMNEWVKGDGDEKVYTISSWDLPHSFMAFKVTRVPCLVKVKEGKVTVVDYYMSVHNFFTEGHKNQGI